MQKIDMQVSLRDIYTDVCNAMENDKVSILEKLKTHIKIESLIPQGFRRAFYKDTGRPRGYKLESFIWFLLLQKIIGIVCDKTSLWF